MQTPAAYKSTWYSPAKRAALGIGKAGYLITVAPSARRRRHPERNIVPDQKPRIDRPRRKRELKRREAHRMRNRRLH